MWEVIWRAGSFLLVICAGYLLRRLGIFGPREYDVLLRVVMNLTIPAAIVISFADFRMDLSLLGVALLGLGLNVLMMALAAAMTRNRDRNTRILHLMNLCGYHVGCFALPFLQGFVGPYGVALACLFDVGNSLVATGGGYAVAESLLREGERRSFSLGDTLKKLLRVVPFVTYLCLIVYTAAGLRVPGAVVTLLTPMANANAFAAMLMIGLMVDFRMERRERGTVLRVVGLRGVLSLLLAAGLYFLLPVGEETRRVLAILALSPISMLSSGFTAQLGGPVGTSAAINSIYAGFSVAAMSVLVVLFGIS